MVTWGPHGAEGSVSLALTKPLDRLQARTSGVTRRVEGRWHNHGVRIDATTAAGADALNESDQTLGVDISQEFKRGKGRLDQSDRFSQISAIESGGDSSEPLGTLGMHLACGVFDTSVVGDKQHVTTVGPGATERSPRIVTVQTIGQIGGQSRRSRAILSTWRHEPWSMSGATASRSDRGR